MRFKNRTNSCSLWIEEAKTMIIWDEKGEADIKDKKAIKYLQDKGYMQVPTLTSNTVSSNNASKKS